MEWISVPLHIDEAQELLLAVGFRLTSSAFSLPWFLFLRPTVSTSCLSQTGVSHLLRIVVQHATHRGLCDGLIWPKTGCASII